MSRCNSKFRIISSKDVPVGAPEDSNRQSHSEQPCSSHTSVRLMAARCGSRAEFAAFTFSDSCEVLENLPASLSVTFITPDHINYPHGLIDAWLPISRCERFGTDRQILTG
jgi:hypothetical protein